MTAPAIVTRVSAPTRLDFAGAWTDVAPFASEQRGVIVNASIDLRSTVTVTQRDSGYRLQADDLDLAYRGNTIDACCDAATQLPLLTAALRRFRPAPCEIRTAATAPAGSGLGTSGALSVALVHALGFQRTPEPDPMRIAAEAWKLETCDAGIPGGLQDQYAAAMGGFQQIVCDRGNVSATPLAIEPAFLAELQSHTLICYTRRSRFSGNTIARVMNAYRSGDANVVDALHRMADLAEQMAAALVASDLESVARVLTANWNEQLRLDSAMCTDQMARLTEAMFRAGAIGGKAAGAGTGGSMFFIVPGDVAAARSAAAECGATLLPFVWATSGTKEFQ